MAVIDDYLKRATPTQRSMLQRIRELVHELVPGVEESISYDIPAFKLNGKAIIYFAAFKNHMSIFPTGDSQIDEISDELKKFRKSKGTLQFTEQNPIPEPLIKKIILSRYNSVSKS